MNSFELNSLSIGGNSWMTLSVRGFMPFALWPPEETKPIPRMDVHFDGQNAFVAAANGDFPLVVLLWGMAMAAQPKPVDLLVETDAAGNSVLHYAAAACEDTPDTVHFLIQQMQVSGRQPQIMEAGNKAKETALIRAAHVGNLRIVDALVNYGQANMYAEDADGNTAVHHAAAQGHLWVLHYLLESQKRIPPAASAPEAKAPAKTPLHFACDAGHRAVVQYLLSNGFNPNDVDSQGRTCIDIARMKKLPWLVALVSFPASSSTSAPSSFRKTRGVIVFLYGYVLFSILATSYVLPWWLALPLIIFVLTKSFKAFSGGHGHGHGHGQKPNQALHPSKRQVRVPPNVSLARAQQSKPEAKKPRASWTLVSIFRKPESETAMGVWLAWMLLFTLFYIVLWTDPDYSSIASDYQIFLIILGAFQIVFFILWLKITLIYPSDPGTISTVQQDLPVILERAAQGIPLLPTTECRTCLVIKPIRSKHCSQCGVCIARLDHHCAWLNRCVGYDNHRSFLLFVAMHSLLLLAYVVLASLVIYDLVVDSSPSKLSSLEVWDQIPPLVSGHLLVILVLFWACACFVALSSMLQQHVRNIKKNLTINEEINWRRYPYLTALKPTPGKEKSSNSEPKIKNAFDRGLCKNVKEFFFHSGPDAVNYHQIFEVPTSGDNMTLTKAVPAPAETATFIDSEDAISMDHPRINAV